MIACLIAVTVFWISCISCSCGTEVYIAPNSSTMTESDSLDISEPFGLNVSADFFDVVYSLLESCMTSRILFMSV